MFAVDVTIGVCTYRMETVSLAFDGKLHDAPIVNGKPDYLHPLPLDDDDRRALESILFWDEVQVALKQCCRLYADVALATLR